MSSTHLLRWARGRNFLLKPKWFRHDLERPWSKWT